MKFKFRADGDDLFIFAMFAIFLLYIVAIVVANVHSFAVDGQLSGINPLPAFTIECIKSTIVFCHGITGCRKGRRFWSNYE